MPTQSLKDCKRCTAITKGGARCRNQTCRGTKCWQHTKSQEGLRVKPSQISDGGFGLHTTRRFAKGEKVANYTGEKMTRAQVKGRYGSERGQYVVCRSDSECFDGRKTSASFARFANDARGTSFRNNARFTPGASNHQPILRTTRAIPASREIFANYGSDYWR